MPNVPIYDKSGIRNYDDDHHAYKALARPKDLGGGGAATSLPRGSSNNHRDEPRVP
jgi:hypothetical protein